MNGFINLHTCSQVFRKKSSVVYKYQVMFVDYGNVEMCGVKVMTVF